LAKEEPTTKLKQPPGYIKYWEVLEWCGCTTDGLSRSIQLHIVSTGIDPSTCCSSNRLSVLITKSCSAVFLFQLPNSCVISSLIKGSSIAYLLASYLHSTFRTLQPPVLAYPSRQTGLISRYIARTSVNKTTKSVGGERYRMHAMW
jgi:hypothetical protein